MPSPHFSRLLNAGWSTYQKIFLRQQNQRPIKILLGNRKLSSGCYGDSYRLSRTNPTFMIAEPVCHCHTCFLSDVWRNNHQKVMMSVFGPLTSRQVLGSQYSGISSPTFSQAKPSCSQNRQGTALFHASCPAPHSAGTATDTSFDGSTRGDHHENSSVNGEQMPKTGRILKLNSGVCYLPHPDKEDTNGEDAHFICVDEQAIGVADGVGSWADLGIDAGEYARELMANSVQAIHEESEGSIDPSKVLEKAYLNTKSKGSSTACIIVLTEQGIHAVNLGDSGFIVVREGCTIFKSPLQQHNFNFTYQLDSNGGDPPSAAQVFTFTVAAGDVIIAGTDGLFDNLYNNEVTAVVVHAVRAGFGPQVTAQKIAALARQRALDKDRQTPFSTAAQDAGIRYYGGKLDDITVVVSYITSSDM